MFLLLLYIAEFGHKPGKRSYYDNMCHVDNLKVARNDLPLPGIVNTLRCMWLLCIPLLEVS